MTETNRTELAIAYAALLGRSGSRIEAGAELGGLRLADQTRSARDIDLVGSWRQHEHGIRYEVIVPPAGLLWNLGRAIHDLLAWLIRHVIRHLQSAAEDR